MLRRRVKDDDNKESPLKSQVKIGKELQHESKMALKERMKESLNVREFFRAAHEVAALPP
jgi:hypothetical protein